jgi:hypothetical protein
MCAMELFTKNFTNDIIFTSLSLAPIDDKAPPWKVVKLAGLESTHFATWNAIVAEVDNFKMPS